MLNLVKHRKAFVLFSLLIIVPGFIALLFWHLDVGIDFTQGSQVEFRPQRTVTEDQVRAYLKSFNLQDLQIVFGENKGIEPAKTAWVDFNTQIDTTAQTAIQKLFTDNSSKFGSKLTFHWATLTDKSNHTFSQLFVSGFSTAPKEADIKDTLTNLPKTSDPTKGAPSDTGTPAATAQATPAATAQPTTTATAQAQATATAQVTNNNPSNITIELKGDKPITFGTTTQTFQILTLSPISTTKTSDTKAITTDQLQTAFLKAGGPYLYMDSNNQVDPAVASETVRNSIFAVIAASVFILLYIWFSFRKVPRAMRYGACAIIALLHDVLVVLGIFSILGHFFHIQVDSLFITALLTVIGFSVHDTIVVFDRVRENMQRRSTETFEEVVNASLVQTMARSLNTSLTVLFTLLALTLFTGIGTSIHTFTLTLLIGIASGTYSSIFNASMLLVMWDKGEWVFKYFGEGGHDREYDRRQARERELVRSRG